MFFSINTLVESCHSTNRAYQLSTLLHLWFIDQHPHVSQKLLNRRSEYEQPPFGRLQLQSFVVKIMEIRSYLVGSKCREADYRSQLSHQ